MTTDDTPPPQDEAAPKVLNPGEMRRKKILILADKSQESLRALRFAARRAQRTRGHLSILAVLEPAEFQHWMSVAEVMQDEARSDAVSLLYRMAGEANRLVGIIPEFVIREGKVREQVPAQIGDDPDVRLLVLGAAPGRDPGPVVSSLLTGHIGQYPIPVTIVPGDLTDDDIDQLA